MDCFTPIDAKLKQHHASLQNILGWGKKLSRTSIGASEERRCALSHTGTCRGKISGEHYISHAVLKLLGPSKTIFIQGAPWSGLDGKTVGKANLTANILCEHHNGRLSGLDSHGARFLGCIQNAQRRLAAADRKSTTHTFDGTKLERWLLKTCFMMWSSGNLMERGEMMAGSPPAEWGEVLAGSRLLNPPLGLYVPSDFGPYAAADDEFEVNPFSGRDGSGIKAVQFKLARVPLALLMGKPDNPDWWGVYRPAAIVLNSSTAQHVLRLTWPDGAAGPAVVHTRVGDWPVS